MIAGLNYETLKSTFFFSDALSKFGGGNDDDAEEALEQEQATEQEEMEKERKRQERLEQVATQNIKSSITSPLSTTTDDEETLG